MEDTGAIVAILVGAAIWWVFQALAWFLILKMGWEPSRLRRSLLVFAMVAPVLVLLTLCAGDLLSGRKIGAETLTLPTVAGLVVFISWLGLITASKVKRSHS